jgi:hypothetical protein
MPIGQPITKSTPPARRATPRKPALAQTAASQHDAREQGLLGLGQIGQAICMMREWFADAGAIQIHWPNVARETASLADQDERIGKAIDYLVSAGPYAGLLTAVLPFGMQIAANHGRIDANAASGLGGVMPPDMLEARMKADMAKAKAEFIRQTQDAMAVVDKAAENPFNGFTPSVSGTAA